MKQTTLCVPLEVKPESCSRLSAYIEDLCKKEDVGSGGHPKNFARVANAIPTLHFLSMSVFTSGAYDPVFILEANFDGTPDVFWGQFEACFGNTLREILRCCKRPLDGDGPLYDAVTAPEARAPIAPYFETRTQWPSAFHQGNRGLARTQILDESRLFLSIQQELDGSAAGPNPYRGVPATEVHRRLRERMLPHHPWLNDPASARIARGERLADILRLLAFAVAVLFVMSIPGIALSALLSLKAYAAVLVITAAAIGFVIFKKRNPLPGTETYAKFDPLAFLRRNGLFLLAYLAGYLVVATALLAPVLVLASHAFAVFTRDNTFGWDDAFRAVWYSLVCGVFSVLLVILPFLLAWIRYLERRDSVHDSPPIDEETRREMTRREDWIVQNHMGSIVLIKPGLLRAIALRTLHRGLGLVVRVTATNGYLASMRTIHFAHWAFLNNGSRLLFFSNFDHSWESYLDDFIEKAHAGLTLAWCSGIGFPPTRFLVNEGASHGRRFKNWALASRVANRFWYSAYPELTVDQIERNNRIATGLRAAHVRQEAADVWLRDL
jgi:hypothetical protein